MSPKHIHITDYTYELPPERIARYPMPQRDQSKLLVYRKGLISQHTFSQIADLLPAGALLIYNNTKVIQARLRFRKPTGALIEIFCLEPYLPRDYQDNFQQRASCQWLCLIGNKKKWHDGPLTLTLGTVTLRAEIVGQQGSSFIIRFTWGPSSPLREESEGSSEGSLSFSEVLELAGELPIPPYLNRATEESDKRTYQTVYSKIDGSVAAPTAGLHFTDAVFRALDAKGIERDEVTLHVGAGTFKPVKSEEMQDHEMHSEYIFVNRRTIERLLAHGCRCTAVGTTSVRTIESLYYIGRKLMRNPQLTEEELHVTQWEPYEETEPMHSPRQGESGQGSQVNSQLSTLNSKCLNAILTWMDLNRTDVLHTSTQIIIAPGYHYHFVERIITNFHMPQSTLLLLVSAFIGNDWRKVYDYALSHDFRFLSYGDSSLLEPILQDENDS